MRNLWQWLIVLFLVGLVAAAFGGEEHGGAVFLGLLALPFVAAFALVLWIDAANRKENKGKTPEQRQAELSALVDRVADQQRRERNFGGKPPR